MIAVTLIEIPQWHNVSLIEAIWLFSGLIAYGIASFRIRPLWWDYRDTKKMGEDDLRIIARGYLRREVIRIITSLFIVGVGLYAAVQPPAIPGPARISIAGLIVTAALLAISFLVSLQSILDWRDREQLRRIVEANNDD